MMLHIDKSTLNNFEEAIQREWLETNGLGGFCSSSIIGCNTRRYHGLLVAATVAPAERMSLVSKLDETIVVGNERFELGANNYGGTIHPNGYQYLTSFTKKLFPEFIYETGNIQLKKTIAMVHGENTVVIIYTAIKASQPFRLELLPLLSVRGYHSLAHANDSVNKNASFNNSIFNTRLYDGTPEIFIKAPTSQYHADPRWFYNFNYSIEQYRGLDFVEDLFTQGTFSLQLKEGDSIGIVISTDYPGKKDAFDLLGVESIRRQSLLSEQPVHETVQQLVLAADQFIVKRGYSSTDGGDQVGATVIAGYHWFTDWGRDTMISLPGLTLSTGRYDDAKKILAAFAKSISMGMLPNRFQDNGQAPQYNNVDGTLWYFVAAYKYLQATNDEIFILGEILPVLKEIIDWHFKGTRYNIHVTEDGLLYAGEIGQQLTWMDAKVGDWVVTARMGKPVEIQALWYNALMIFSELLQLNNQLDDAALTDISAEKAKQSFTEKFWYAKGNHLYDSINENNAPVTELRPNQLFAISLPFALIEGDKAKAVLQIVREQLYTAVGLKTLPKSDVHYIPVYGGDVYHRDSAYHQGTVWSWLLGPYVDTIIKVERSSSNAQAVIDAFKYHLNEACIGSVSEIFDANTPHHPRGCIAQAWGVAEILRVIKDYQLFGNTQLVAVAQK
jgi:predicted glycogen debranching enzyme